MAKPPCYVEIELRSGIHEVKNLDVSVCNVYHNVECDVEWICLFLFCFEFFTFMCVLRDVYCLCQMCYDVVMFI